MITARFIGIAFALCGPTAAFACDEVVHSCTFKQGATQVQVCLNPQTVTYDYGPTGGTPDLSLAVTIADAEYTPWPGVGNAIFEGVTFRNGAFSYEVFGGSPKLDENDELGPLFGGIIISENNETIARLSCDEGSVVWAGYGTDGIYGAKTAAGQCWDSRNRAWELCE